MLEMKLQHLTNMGNWEAGKHVQYVQCAVYTVCTVYSHWERVCSMYSMYSVQCTSTCKWDRVVRTVVQYVLRCHMGTMQKPRPHWTTDLILGQKPNATSPPMIRLRPKGQWSDFAPDWQRISTWKCMRVWLRVGFQWVRVSHIRTVSPSKGEGTVPYS
jgi:hypothetical protein